MVLDNETTDVWGSENATIVSGTNSGVSPFGRDMLNVARGGTVQTVQITNLASIPNMINMIDSGFATYDLNAQFTAGAGVSGTRGQLIISFYDSLGIDSSNLSLNRIGLSNSSLFLDASIDWELITEAGAVPAGARFVISELVYLPGGSAGETFVDAASLTIVPEPSSVALLGLGATTLLFRRRRLG
jgi:hypothetical protein